jgi:hypothetical protein
MGSQRAQCSIDVTFGEGPNLLNIRSSSTTKESLVDLALKPNVLDFLALVAALSLVGAIMLGAF